MRAVRRRNSMLGRALASVLIGVVLAALPIILLGILRLEGRSALASILLIMPGALLVLSLGFHPRDDPTTFMVAAVVASALLYTTVTWVVLIALPSLVGRMMRDSDPDR
jgi:hypothetical protein